MRLEALQAQVEQQFRAPTERWDPPFCGDLDLVIRANGEWHYAGSAINRPALVKLFAQVIRREGDEYFLVTPVEKVRIQVEDLPFLITEWAFVDANEGRFLRVETNIGERYVVTTTTPIVLEGELPAVKIRDNLLARVHRNVYYQWAEHVEEAQHDEAPGYYLKSGNERYLVGQTNS